MKKNHHSTKKLKPNKSFNKIVLIFFVLALAPIGYFLLFSKAAPNPPTIYLNPASQALPVNTNFTVEIRENSGTTKVNAVQANFSYPAALVDFVSIDATGSAFATQAQATGANGQVSIGRGVAGGNTGVSGDQLVAKVNFKTKTTGGAVAMSFTAGTYLVNATTNQDLLGSLAATGGGNYIIDNVAPTVSVTSPANLATINGGSTTTISVTATDASSSVTAVDIYIDGVIKTTLTASPYNYSWNTTGVALGAHTIQAKATDSFSNQGSSSVVNVTLADQTAPTVSLTAPAANAKLSGTQNINAAAADNVAVAKVEFYVDGVLKGTDTTSPYSYSWATTTATNATHSLTAKAYDTAATANVTTSSAVSVLVDNSPPTMPGNIRSTGTSLNSISLAWDASTDNNGVTGYRLSRAGNVIATPTGTSYNDTGLTPGTAYNYSLVALDGAGNTSTAATLTLSTNAAKPGDINGDNVIDITDLSILLTDYTTTSARSDINSDGIVDIFDLSILLTNYGT